MTQRLNHKISDLKSVISKRGGLAKANKFIVNFAPPTQALLDLNANSVLNAILNTNVSPLSLINNPLDVSILCSGLTVPGRTLGTQAYSMGNKLAVDIPTNYSVSDITFNFILTNDFLIRRILETWMALVFDQEDYSIGYYRDYVNDVTVTMLDNRGFPVFTFKLLDAYPKSVEGTALNNESSSVISVSTVMTFENYEILPLSRIPGEVGRIGGSILTNTRDQFTGIVNRARTLL